MFVGGGCESGEGGEGGRCRVCVQYKKEKFVWAGMKCLSLGGSLRWAL
jgi:hypothetical protein